MPAPNITPPRDRTMANSKRRGVASERGRFLRLHDMVASTGLSESTIRRRVRDGDLPKPTALTTRCVGWWERDFEAWADKHRSAVIDN